MTIALLPVLSNRKRNPYYAGSSDEYIMAKLEVYDKHRLSYQPEVPVEFWLNYSNSWQVYESGVTNRYGMFHFSHPCTNVPDINCCLGVAKVTYGGATYTSNIVRFNFIESESRIFDIDAAWQCTSPTDRSSYDIFDGNSRTNDIYDRMRGNI